MQNSAKRSENHIYESEFEMVNILEEIFKHNILHTLSTTYTYTIIHMYASTGTKDWLKRKVRVSFTYKLKMDRIISFFICPRLFPHRKSSSNIHSDMLQITRKIIWMRIMKLEQESNLHHPISGRLFYQLNYPIFSSVFNRDDASIQQEWFRMHFRT